jgi:glycosyltransferase involved in cell wall biosynthesis
LSLSNCERLPISLVVITKNEESQIEDCLRSVPFVDEIVVVDSESSDQTVERATRLGARVVQQSFLGFRAQKQFATDQARHAWVLNLDADERLSPELANEIVQLFSEGPPKGVTAYQMPRLSFHLGGWIYYGGWHPDYQTRLYDRTQSRWTGEEVHESIASPHTKKLKSSIQHFVFKSLSHQVLTNDRYSTLGAEQLRRRGERHSLLKMLVKPWIKFFECYFFKMGFLDGRAGFIIAVGASYSVFLRHAKVWESQIEKS